MKRQKNCIDYPCNKPIFKQGRCLKHSDELDKNEKRKDDAAHALHYLKVDDAVFTNPRFFQEMNSLAEWWRKACDSVNNSKPDKLLRDEAKYAISWCIILAQEFVDAERAYRLNLSFEETMLNHTYKWVWDNFNNLKNGLTSNGEARAS